MANFVGKYCLCTQFLSRKNVATDVLFLNGGDGETILQMTSQDATIDVQASGFITFTMETQPEQIYMQLIGLPTTEPGQDGFVWNDNGTLKIKTS